MKKILAVVGSPRKGGNTDVLLDRMAEGARREGGDVEKIYLSDLKITECDGCHRCWQGRDCSKDDDMSALYATIAGADAFIFGTPVYWYGPTGLMKLFIDRFVYFNCAENRANVQGKSVVIAVPFEEEVLETARGVVEFFEKSLAYLEMKLLGKLIVPGVSGKGDILKRAEYLEEARKVGKRLVLG